jgi:hypothetical protein
MSPAALPGRADQSGWVDLAVARLLLLQARPEPQWVRERRDHRQAMHSVAQVPVLGLADPCLTR